MRGTFDEKSLAQKIPWQAKATLRKTPQWTAQLGAGGVDSPPVPTADGKHLVALDRDGWVHLIAVDTGEVHRPHPRNLVEQLTNCLPPV